MFKSFSSDIDQALEAVEEKIALAQLAKEEQKGKPKRRSSISSLSGSKGMCPQVCLPPQVFALNCSPRPQLTHCSLSGCKGPDAAYDSIPDDGIRRMKLDDFLFVSGCCSTFFILKWWTCGLLHLHPLFVFNRELIYPLPVVVFVVVVSCFAPRLGAPSLLSVS